MQYSTNVLVVLSTLCLMVVCYIRSLGHGGSEQGLFARSVDVVQKYDLLRGRNVIGKLKFSTNTFDEIVMSRNDTVDQQVLDADGVVQRENATILMLVRNWELQGALESMRSLEDRFNRNFHYSWTFLNDVPFERDFIEATTAMASGPTYYGIVPADVWDCPASIDQTQMNRSLTLMKEQGVVHGGSLSYRNMCRFNSGYFFKHKLLIDYDYYFRVEPNVEYFCDFPYDPFKVMREKQKKYGFVISLYEYEDTIPTLWDAVEEYIELYEEEVGLDFENNAYNFITDKDIIGKTYQVIDSDSDYNLCHFWSNFEIGDLNFYRSDRYLEFFKFLEEKGGFYYERWGDAPVHTIAAALLLNRNEIIHFDEIGYLHSPFLTCPTSYYLRIMQRCQCDFKDELNIDVLSNSCLPRWWKHGSGKTFLKE